MGQIFPLSRLEDCKRVRTICRPLPEKYPTKPLTVLIAENDPCDALLLEQALFSAGLHIPLQFVADGQDVIEYLRGDPPFDNRIAYPLPTLLLLDLDLPRMDGLKVLEWLQSQPGLTRTHIVVFTSCSRPDAIDRAYVMGADSYLLKPVDRGELIDVAAHLTNYWLERSLFNA